MKCKHCGKDIRKDENSLDWVHNTKPFPLFGCYDGNRRTAEPAIFQDYAQSLLRYQETASIIRKKTNTKSTDSISGIL